jgi:DNA-binding IclR family transcriptional regulator
MHCCIDRSAEGAHVEPRRTPDRSTLSSVAKALLLLEHFEKHASISVSEAAELLGVAPSSAHRALSTLRESGFIRQQESGRRYEAGQRLLDIAVGALRQVDIREIARPYLNALSKAVPAQIWLNRLDLRRVYTLDMHLTTGVAIAEAGAVSKYPAHTSASGKVLLSHLPRTDLDRLYPQERLEVCTERSVSRKTDLLRELELVRRFDYAVQVGEQLRVSAGVAVPLFGAPGEMLGAIAVTVPAREFDGRTMRTHAVLAREAADSISRDVRDRLPAAP